MKHLKSPKEHGASASLLRNSVSTFNCLQTHIEKIANWVHGVQLFSYPFVALDSCKCQLRIWFPGLGDVDLAWINIPLQSLTRGLALHLAQAWYKFYNSLSLSEMSIKVRNKEDLKTGAGLNSLKRMEEIASLTPASGEKLGNRKFQVELFLSLYFEHVVLTLTFGGNSGRW